MMRMLPTLGLAVIVAVVTGCATSGAIPAGKTRGVWNPQRFGEVLKAETSINKNYFKAAPQLQNFTEVLRLATAIDRQFSFEVVDQLESAPAAMGDKVLVFSSFLSPEIVSHGKTRVVVERGEEKAVFELEVRIMPPTAYRLGEQYGPVKKLPVQKTAKVQYRLICSPGAPEERAICFHRELLMEPLTTMATQP